MITKQITLSTGITVTVAPVPQKVYDVIRMRHPDPPVPVLESKATATGEAMKYENRKDPDYQEALRDAKQARQRAWAEAMFLFGLPEVVVPDEWEGPPVTELAYLAPDWKQREGDQGRKLDYIEWELLRTPGDHGKVVDAINELADVPEEAVDAIEATFRGDVEVQGQEASTD